jgi:hypothetical protein
MGEPVGHASGTRSAARDRAVRVRANQSLGPTPIYSIVWDVSFGAFVASCFETQYYALGVPDATTVRSGSPAERARLKMPVGMRLSEI